jgi:hypothetical protein
MKIQRIILIAYILVASSCGYLDRDNEILNETIIGRFSLHQQENSDEVNLCVTLESENQLVLINDCQNVVVDNANKIIYVKEILGASYKYSEIKIFDLSKGNKSAYNIHILTEQQFNEEIKNCAQCKIKYEKVTST